MLYFCFADACRFRGFRFWLIISLFVDADIFMLPFATLMPPAPYAAMIRFFRWYFAILFIWCHARLFHAADYFRCHYADVFSIYLFSLMFSFRFAVYYLFILLPLPWWHYYADAFRFIFFAYAMLPPPIIFFHAILFYWYFLFWLFLLLIIFRCWWCFAADDIFMIFAATLFIIFFISFFHLMLFFLSIIWHFDDDIIYWLLYGYFSMTLLIYFAMRHYFRYWCHAFADADILPRWCHFDLPPFRFRFRWRFSLALPFILMLSFFRLFSFDFRCCLLIFRFLSHAIYLFILFRQLISFIIFDAFWCFIWWFILFLRCFFDCRRCCRHDAAYFLFSPPRRLCCHDYLPDLIISML